MRTLGRFALLLGLALATPSVAAAQSKADMAAAKKRYKEGTRHYKAEQYLDAAEAFKEAYELTQKAELLYNIGQSYRHAGKLQEAEQYLQQYLAEAPDANNAEEVVQTIVELQQQIAANMATVSLETDVPAGVWVADETEPRCTTPCSVMLPPGKRRLTFRAAEKADAVKSIELEPGKTIQLRVELAAAVVAGRLLVQSDLPGSRLLVGEELEVELPLQEPLELPPGEHAVVVTSSRARWDGNVAVEPNETTLLAVPMQALDEARKKASVRRSVAYGLWGVTVASAAGGILLGLQARSTFDQLSSQQSDRGFVPESQLEQGRRQQFAANLMFGVSGAAAVGGLALFLWDDLFGGETADERSGPSADVAQVKE